MSDKGEKFERPACFIQVGEFMWQPLYKCGDGKLRPNGDPVFALTPYDFYDFFWREVSLRDSEGNEHIAVEFDRDLYRQDQRSVNLIGWTIVIGFALMGWAVGSGVLFR